MGFRLVIAAFPVLVIGAQFSTLTAVCESFVSRTSSGSDNFCISGRKLLASKCSRRHAVRLLPRRDSSRTRWNDNLVHKKPGLIEPISLCLQFSEGKRRRNAVIMQTCLTSSNLRTSSSICVCGSDVDINEFATSCGEWLQTVVVGVEA